MAGFSLPIPFLILIEHRLFCHITANWRGTPLTTYETIVDRIGNTRTAAGLQVRAKLDDRQYPTGVTMTKAQMNALALVSDEGVPPVVESRQRQTHITPPSAIRQGRRPLRRGAPSASIDAHSP